MIKTIPKELEKNKRIQNDQEFKRTKRNPKKTTRIHGRKRNLEKLKKMKRRAKE
jgi:hypothetical protein